ncbi:hypothetical protein PPERSA_09266 [Pseudocohnilembus persalinus]|uniref:TRAF-like protein n=1 Tax=Pseudocohnilembus persalinus TaxID=266149 RepID=A0A0V0QM11_PSEPJ|nr:hypothetical protein PPERSA_09266 [Pseudocohnilembus persalinus]|eukprot:KRX03254.1 hypothetical protein PPERSA_09266 [Pseudocohnilembus persalinus]
MSLKSISSSSCLESERIIPTEDNQFIIQENICELCGKIACNIFQCQLGCGALFGQDCMTQLHMQKCPKCQKQLKQPLEKYKNRYLNNLMLDVIQVKCSYNNRGCQQILPFDPNQIQKHENSCQYQKIKTSQEIKEFEQQIYNDYRRFLLF